MILIYFRKLLSVTTFCCITLFFSCIDNFPIDFAPSVTLNNGEILAGKIPLSKQKLVVAWIEIHQEDLLANWELVVNGRTPFKVKGLDQ